MSTKTTAEQALSFLDSLFRAQALTLPLVHRHLWRHVHLSLSELLVLRAAATVPGTSAPTMSDLQDATSMSAAGITRIVGSLESQGLACRARRHDDRRLVQVDITEAGALRLRESMGALRAVAVTLIANLVEADDLACTAEVLGRLSVRARTAPAYLSREEVVASDA